MVDKQYFKRRKHKAASQAERGYLRCEGNLLTPRTAFSRVLRWRGMQDTTIPPVYKQAPPSINLLVRYAKRHAMQDAHV